MTIDFESQKRARDHDPNRVRCAHCGRWILARETRCPKCGVYFKGEAFQFTHEGSDEIAGARVAHRRRAAVIVLALLLILIVGTTLYFATG